MLSEKKSEADLHSKEAGVPASASGFPDLILVTTKRRQLSAAMWLGVS